MLKATANRTYHALGPFFPNVPVHSVRKVALDLREEIDI
jgi:hypothetical protein